MSINTTNVLSVKTNPDLRSELADLIGGNDIVSQFGPDIIRAFEHFHFNHRVGLPTKNKLDQLQKMRKLCDDLIETISEHKIWLFARTDAEMSPVLGVEEIIEGGSASPLNEFRRLLGEALVAEPKYSGRANIKNRRRLWTWLTAVYEEATLRRAATSKNKDGVVSGNFVRYLILLSGQSRALGIVTPDMVDQFVDWYRSGLSECDREEITEVRMMANALHTPRQG